MFEDGNFNPDFILKQRAYFKKRKKNKNKNTD